MTTITNPQIEKATYSPEDNKLRLYPLERLDSELYARVKECKFGWAPKQDLFFAFWSPAAEDLCLELAGEIEPEETTLVERAEAKAERLKALAEKRADQARGFSAAAQRVCNFGDQPILMGHHSQRKMEKAKVEQERNQERAENAASAVRYWNWKMMGTLAHATYKNRSDVIERRIKTLLTDLRKYQRYINDADDARCLWEKCQGIADADKQLEFAKTIANYRWDICVQDTWRKLDKGAMTAQEAIDLNLAFAHKKFAAPNTRRYMTHILNRLEYEQALLGPVSRYSGSLTAALLQTFLRTHGAEKPKATKSDYGWIVECPNPLPVHIGEGKTLELDDDEWKDLMVEVGYDVPAKKAAKPPILNFDASVVAGVHCQHYGRPELLKVVEMTKAQYSAIYTDSRGTRLSTCGQFRVKICQDPSNRNVYSSCWVIPSLIDSKMHPVPVSDSIVTQEELKALEAEKEPANA